MDELVKKLVGLGLPGIIRPFAKVRDNKVSRSQSFLEPLPHGHFNKTPKHHKITD